MSFFSQPKPPRPMPAPPPPTPQDQINARALADRRLQRSRARGFASTIATSTQGLGGMGSRLGGG